MSVLEQIHAAFHRPNTTAWRRVNGTVWVLIILSTVLLVVDLSVEPEWPGRAILAPVDDGILLLFWVELVLRIGSYRPPELNFYKVTRLGRLRVAILSRVRFSLTPMVLIDILTVMGSLPILRGLRSLRLLRLLRSRRILRYANPFESMARAFEENRLLYLFGLSVFATAVLVGGLSFYLTEHEVNDQVSSIPDGVWWAIVTVTTVGYGDLIPVTAVGRVVAGTMMVIGMTTLALFAGIVGSTLMGSVLSMREESFRMSNYLNHVVICGFEPGAQMLLQTLSDELDLSVHSVVIFAPMERPKSIPAEFAWVEGDPTKESELDKVRIGYADAAIVVGSRERLPQLADAQSILVTFTIRRFLRRHADLLDRRQRPLYIVTEILDAENVEHARTAGADEVIETRRMGFSMLSHAVEAHGTATLVGELADVHGHSLFIGELPHDIPGANTVANVRSELKRRHDILVLGVRDLDGSDRLNPADDLELTAGQPVIYMSKGPVMPTV